MKSPNRGAGNRSLLNGPGKGSADRTTDSKTFSLNFDEIRFGSVVADSFGAEADGFVHTGNKQRKVYGPRSEKPHGPHICIK